MSQQLPARPNLEFLKKRAKERLVECRARGESSSLVDAQHAIARDYGFVNWTALKQHIGSHTRLTLVGRWKGASGLLHFEIKRDDVAITDFTRDAGGVLRRNTNRLVADGAEHPADHGYTVLARWVDRALEVFVRHGGAIVSHVTYEVAAGGESMMVSSGGIAHAGYPAVEQAVRFQRVDPMNQI